MAHNPHEKSAHHYNFLDDLEQSPATMSTFEVFQTCPSQMKELLTTLGAIDPSDSHLITFGINESAPPLSSSMVVQISVTLKNICTYCCVIDEGASTCIISTKIWKD